MAEMQAPLTGDVLFVTFSAADRLHIHHYHPQSEFKEVKSLPIVRSILQLQPIVLQFVEDFLKSRLEVAFDSSGAGFKAEALESTLYLIADSGLSDNLKAEVGSLYSTLVDTLERSQFQKVTAEKSLRNTTTGKTEKSRESLQADYHLALHLLYPAHPVESSLKRTIVKDGKMGSETTIQPKASPSLPFLEKDAKEKGFNASYQLVISYHDINHLFALLNNRHMASPQFGEFLREAFGKEAADRLMAFFFPTPMQPAIVQSSPTPEPLEGESEGSQQLETPISEVEDLSSKPVQAGKYRNPPKQIWLLAAAAFGLLLTAAFAIPAILAVPVNCGHSLLLTMIQGNTQQVKRMVQACPEFRNPEQPLITIRDHDYRSPVILACALGDLAMLRILHEEGSFPLNRPENPGSIGSVKGWSAPWAAVAFNRPAILDYLASQGVLMDTRQGPTGETPLLHAIATGNLYLLEKLLDAGADPDFSDSKGQTPLAFALALKDAGMVRILLQRGASATIQGLDKSVSKSTPELVALLKRYSSSTFTFLDAFQENSPFRRDIPGSFVNEEEHLVIQKSLYRIYPFDFPKSAAYQFSGVFQIPKMEVGGDFGIIFSSSKSEKLALVFSTDGRWALKRGQKLMHAGRIPPKKISGDKMHFRIRKMGNDYHFTFGDNTLLKTELPEPSGNYFGFQVENQLQRGDWTVERYKIQTY